MRRIAVLDAPSNLGLRPPTATSVPGCAKAPGALRDHGLLSRLGARDAGCLTPPRYDPGDWRPGDGVAHAQQIANYSRALADRIGAILDAGEFPVILGGDCSILLGSGIAMHRLGDAIGGNIGLVFVDGHSDFRHPGNASYVGAAAGEDLALATGRGQADLAAIEGRRPYFRDVDVVVMGIRAQDEYRLDLQAAGIVTRPVPALRAEGAARSAQWAREQLADCAGYWVHIDVDVLDPAVMPAVDAPSPGGIAFPELELLLAGLVESPHCLGVEITVFDPDYDPDGSYAAEITSAVTAGLEAARTVAAVRPDLVAARLDIENADLTSDPPVPSPSTPELPVTPLDDGEGWPAAVADPDEDAEWPTAAADPVEDRDWPAADDPVEGRRWTSAGAPVADSEGPTVLADPISDDHGHTSVAESPSGVDALEAAQADEALDAAVVALAEPSAEEGLEGLPGSAGDEPALDQPESTPDISVTGATPDISLSAEREQPPFEDGSDESADGNAAYPGGTSDEGDLVYADDEDEPLGDAPDIEAVADELEHIAAWQDDPLSDAVESDALEGQAPEGQALEGQALEGRALEGRALGDHALEDDTPEAGAVEPADEDRVVPLRARPLGLAPLLDSEPLPATRPGMLRPRTSDVDSNPNHDRSEAFTLPTQRPAFDVGTGEPADIA